MQQLEDGRRPRLVRQQLAERDARVERRRARPLGEPLADGRALLLEPLGREEPVAGALHRGEAPARARPGASSPRACSSSPVTGARTIARTIDSGSPRSSSSSRCGSKRRGGEGSSTDAAADGRLGAQDDAVAAGGDDRLAQAQLGVAALAHDAGGHVARPDVDGDRGRHGLELLERDVEPPADRVGARLDEHVAAPELRARDPRQVDRDALPRLGALDLDVVHLDAAGAGAQAGGLDAQLVARLRSSPSAACP